VPPPDLAASQFSSVMGLRFTRTAQLLTGPVVRVSVTTRSQPGASTFGQLRGNHKTLLGRRHRLGYC
jgi:hypothetical protein